MPKGIPPPCEPWAFPGVPPGTAPVPAPESHRKAHIESGSPGATSQTARLDPPLSYFHTFLSPSTVNALFFLPKFTSFRFLSLRCLSFLRGFLFPRHRPHNVTGPVAATYTNIRISFAASIYL